MSNPVAALAAQVFDSTLRPAPPAQQQQQRNAAAPTSLFNFPFPRVGLDTLNAVAETVDPAQQPLDAPFMIPAPALAQTRAATPGVGYMNSVIDRTLGVGANQPVSSMLSQLPYQSQKLAAAQNPDLADEMAILAFAHSLESSFRRDVVRRFVNHVAAVTGENVRKMYSMDPKLLEALHRDLQHGDYDRVEVFPRDEVDAANPGSIAKRLRANYGLQPRVNEEAQTYERLAQPYWALNGPDVPRPKLAKTSAWDFICQFIPELAADMTQARIKLLQPLCPRMGTLDENRVLAHDEAWVAWAVLTAIEHTKRRISTGKLDRTTASNRIAHQYDLSNWEMAKSILRRCGWVT